MADQAMSPYPPGYGATPNRPSLASPAPVADTPALDQVMNQSRYICDQVGQTLKDLSTYIDAISGDAATPSTDVPKQPVPCGGRVGETFSINTESLRLLSLISQQIQRLRRI